MAAADGGGSGLWRGAVAAIVLAPLALGAAAVSELSAERLQRAAGDLSSLPDAAPLTVGLACGFGAVVLIAIAFAVARRRLASWVTALPAGLVVMAAYVSCARWLVDPAVAAPDKAFGERAAGLLRALAGASSLGSLALALAALLLGVGSVALGLRARALGAAAVPSRGARFWWALVAGALLSIAVPLLIVVLRIRGLGTTILCSWSAALPSGLGVLAVLLGAAKIPADDREAIPASTGVLAAAAAGVGAVLLSGLGVLLANLRLLLDDIDLIEIDLAALMNELWIDSRALAAAALLFTLPILAAVLVAVRQRALRAALRRPRAALAVGVLVVGVPALLALGQARAATRRVSALWQAQQRLTSHPGVPIVDETLPPGTLIVDLVSAVPEVKLRRSAQVSISATNQVRRWTPASPARFEGLRDARHELSVQGFYLWEPTALAMPDTSAGARIAIEVLPLTPTVAAAAASPAVRLQTPDKELELDMTRPEAFVLRWIQGDVIVRISEVPRVPFAPGALAAAVAKEWREDGGHRDPSDRMRDVAIVRTLPGTPLREAKAVALAVLETRREFKQRSGKRVEQAAFELSLAEPRPKRKLSIDDEVAPPPDSAAPALNKALARCRAAYCTPGLRARLWLRLGQALSAEGQADEAVAAFVMARALDPAAALDPGAGDASTSAFEAAAKQPAPRVTPGRPSVSGRLSPEVVSDVLASIERDVRACYLAALRERPDLSGKLATRFVIGADGAVSNVGNGGSDVKYDFAPCIAKSFQALSFPVPERGIVTVVYPILLEPPR